MSLIVGLLLIGLFEYLTGKCLGNVLAPFFGWILDTLRSILNRF